MLTDAQRRGLYAALEDKLGSEPATSLMNESAQIDWSDVARRSDIANLRTELHGEIIELRAELKGDISGLKGEIAEVKGDISELRAELKAGLTEVRAELKGVVARQLVASVPLAFGVAGLVLAAAKLA